MKLISEILLRKGAVKNVLTNVKDVFRLLSAKEKFILIGLSVTRILLGLLDLFGIILLGLLLTKVANNLVSSASILPLGIFQFFEFTNRLSFLNLAVAMLAMFVGKSIFAIIVMKAIARYLASLENKIGIGIFKKILQYPYSVLYKQTKEELVYALTISLNSAVTKKLSILVTILSESVLLILIICLFLFVDLTTTFAIVIYFLVVGITMQKFFGNEYAKTGKANTDSSIQTFSSIEEFVNNYREIFAHNKHDEFISKFSTNRKDFAETTAYLDFLTAVPRYIVESALMVGAISLAAFTFTTSTSTEAAGLLGIFLTGGLRIMASMLPLQASLSIMKQLNEQSLPFLNLESLVRFDKNVEDSSHELHNSNYPPEIHFRNVYYAYPESKDFAVKDLTFTIHAGETVAFIGPSGAGKSTVADLLIGLIEPSSGYISFGSEGKSSEYSIGYVPQAPGLVKGSLLDNITLNITSKSSDLDSLQNAIQIADLEDLARELPLGLEADLGKNLDGLSGGQLQRIGLARAVYNKPEVLILDEATSSLDPDSEFAISQALFELKETCTIVLIAHRFSTFQDVDKVFVMSEGELIAEGKFKDLAQTNPIVARFIELSKIDTSI